MSELIIIETIKLFGTPEVLNFIGANFVIPTKYFMKGLFNKVKNKLLQGKINKQVFTSFFRALSARERELIKELIFNGKAERGIYDFYIEGSAGLRTKVFESIVHYTWINECTSQEEIEASKMPIQITRCNGKWTKDFEYHFDGYSFELLPEYRKHWKKLYHKLPKELKYINLRE